jgi:N utilization substance protein B
MTKKTGRLTANRSTARLFALQALYEIALSGRAAADVTENFLTSRIAEETAARGYEPPDKRLFRGLVTGAEREAQDIDSLLIAVLAEDWPLERLETLLRSLLRAAVYELGWCPEVPARVVINEYVDLASAFFSEGEPGMVNGLLDNLGRQLRPEEFHDQGAR